MYQQSERPVFNARQVISPIHYDVINKKVEQYRILFTIHLLFQQDNKMQKKREGKIWTQKKWNVFCKILSLLQLQKKIKRRVFFTSNFLPTDEISPLLNAYHHSKSQF